ncbi:MAG: nucleoside-diphosphate kinase [Candidatus Paceibacterota bacterium]|jgi:nucleoside diphosphate kinase
MEQSVYIIKPEGMLLRNAIRQMILSAGLSVADFYTVMIPRWVPAVLYPSLSREDGEIWRITCEHLINKKCEIGIVRGERAIERLVAVCGAETNPMQCDPLTVRGLFGEKTPIELAGGERYWLNAIHRSKNHEEVLRDAKIHFALRSSGSC